MRFLAVLAVFALAAPSTDGPAASVHTAETDPSVPRKLANVPDLPARSNFQETLFGISISDPWRWMEDPARRGEMTAWLKAASDHGRAQLALLPGRQSLAAAIQNASRAGTEYADVQEAAGRIFARRLDPDAALPKLIMRDSNGEERVLFDPSAEARNSPVAINNYRPSPNGELVAVHTGLGGGEVGTIRFLEVDTGRWRPDALEPIWGEIAVNWFDARRVLFSRMTTRKDIDPMQFSSVRLHRLGAPVSEQIVLLAAGESERPDVDAQEMVVVITSPISPWTLGVAVSARADRRVFVAQDAAVGAGRPAWRELASYDDQIMFARARSADLFYVTTRNAPNGELRRLNLQTGSPAGSSLVLPASDVVLRDVLATADGVYVVSETDGVNGLLFLPNGRAPAHSLALEPGTIDMLSVSADGKRLYFGLTTYTRNRRFFVADTGRARETGINSSSYSGADKIEVVREEAVSADGTRVPLTILRLKGAARTAQAPTLLNGYGAYGLSRKPFYAPTTLTWVERGGVFAECGVRGGGEKGRAWHEAGRAANKPNAHADFIGCAERLIALGYAQPGKLAITGRSAGGLLAPPTALKRPDLFRVVVPQVGVVNPTRLGVAANGANQFAEMGDPNTAAGFKALAAQDGYLMLDQAQASPDWFLTVGLNDARVEPWMSAKFAARALERFGKEHLVFVRADPEAGHGIGSTRDQVIEEWADIYSFLLNRFGDSDFQLPAKP